MLCSVVLFGLYLGQSNQVTQQQSELRKAGEKRVDDLIAGCRRTSQRTAADVNLNYLYYVSETKLSSGTESMKAIKAAFASLSPGEQHFILALEQSGQPSQTILHVRAAAEYAAARVKANAVDLKDAALVHVVTPLGKDPTPRRWVLEARFSCANAFH